MGSVVVNDELLWFKIYSMDVCNVGSYQMFRFVCMIKKEITCKKKHQIGMAKIINEYLCRFGIQIFDIMSEKERSLPSLGACLAMDAMGMASYFLPFVGETIDALWAIVAAVVFYRWFRSPIGAVTAAAEELLPKTDIVPMFTIAYFLFRRKAGKKQS